MEPITRNLTVVAAMAIICASAAVFAADKANPKTEAGFVNLYNGKDLTGWEIFCGSETYPEPCYCGKLFGDQSCQRGSILS